MAIDTKDILDDIQIAVEEAVDDHMKVQPYSCMCSVCQEDLVVYKVVDCDKDLLLLIEPCAKCPTDA